MTVVKQRWNTKYATDKALLADTKRVLASTFKDISHVQLTEKYCSFTLNHHTYDSFPHNYAVKLSADDNSIHSINLMTDAEIVIHIRDGQGSPQAQLVHDWLLTNVFEVYPFIK